MSDSKVLGATLDPSDSLDSDPGPNLLNLMQLKWPQDFRFRLHQAPPGASESNAYTEADASKVGPKARTLASVGALDLDPGP